MHCDKYMHEIIGVFFFFPFFFSFIFSLFFSVFGKRGGVAM
jgi:hypothetical protein